MPRLVVEDGSRSLTVEIDASLDRATIGRADGNTIVIEDTVASREHCALEKRPDGWWVLDLASRNGTAVNGRRVPSARLSAGDRIEIGAASITFFPDEDDLASEESANDGRDRPKRASKDAANPERATLGKTRGSSKSERLPASPSSERPERPSSKSERLPASAPAPSPERSRRATARAHDALPASAKPTARHEPTDMAMPVPDVSSMVPSSAPPGGSSSGPQSIAPGTPGTTGASDLEKDPDTGLASFAKVQSELAARLRPGRSANEPGRSGNVAVLRIDLDGLGLVNELFGFESGDEAIRAAARAVREAVRGEPSALAGREAGGKFVVLLSAVAPHARLAEATLESALRLAEEARRSVEALPLEGMSLSASVGVALAPEDGARPREVLRQAEIGLAQAKQRGRNRVVHVPRGARRSSSSHEALPRESSDGTLGPRPTSSAAFVALSSDRPREKLALTREGQRSLQLAAHVLEADLDLEPLLDLALDAITREANARRGLVVLRQADGALSVAAFLDRENQVRPDHVLVSHAFLRAALDSKDGAIVVDDARTDERLASRPSVVAGSARSLIAAPIGSAGALYLDADEPSRFQAAERDLVTAFGRLLAGPVRRAASEHRTRDELARTQLVLARTSDADVRRRARFSELLGKSAVMDELRRLVERVAASSAPVLVRGESGSGKELVARAIHASSPRAGRAFVAESCAAIAEDLLEAELFGARKGAYTGSDRDRPGLFRAAHEATLFLDEIGELSLRTQAKLLRVLETGEVRRLGDDAPTKVDVRVLAATHRDLRAMVAQGAFREDLYYRLDVLRVELPPLRARRDDVPLLLEHFLARAAREAGREPPVLDPRALAVLVHHEWPGNVRQLENEARKLVLLAVPRLGLEHLSPDVLGPQPVVPRGEPADAAAEAMLAGIATGLGLQEMIDAAERKILARVLVQSHENRSETARVLGLSRAGLLKMMKRLRID